MESATSHQQQAAQAADFPAVGNAYEVKFGGDYVFHLHFMSASEKIFAGQLGAFKEYVETVQITPVRIRPGAFMIYWKEASKTEVVHVEDFDNGVAFTNITPPGGPAVHLAGTLQRIGSPGDAGKALARAV